MIHAIDKTTKGRVVTMNYDVTDIEFDFDDEMQLQLTDEQFENLH